jgi:hypothetical protein
MNEDVKKLWIEALKSGKYKQDKGQLRSDKGYCCLGVLCDIYINQNEKLKWEKDTNFEDKVDKVYGLHDERINYLQKFMLTTELKQWAGMSEFNHDYFYINHLIALNDSGKDFDRIADTIERVF